MLTTTDDLPNDIESLKDLVLEFKHKYESVLEQFKISQQQRYAPSSEKNLIQGDLFDEAGCPQSEEKEDNTTTVKAHERQSHPKRTILPDHFPREDQRYDISDAEKRCACGNEKESFAEEITEQLDVIPPQLKVIRHIRPKYSCKKCEDGVTIAPMPNLLLPKSIAAPGLVAHTITAKYVDHLPLYRQEQIWKRYGINIPRNSSCGWLMKTSELCEPLYDLIKQHIVSGSYIQADETPVQVLNEPDRRNQQKSYIWLYRGGPKDQIATYFEYQETRAAIHPKSFLSGFKGYLQTDGYAGYDWVNDTEEIVHLACMAHARRPFAELVKLVKKSGKAHQAVAYIGELYAIEDQARKQHLSPQERYALRLEKSAPILNEIRTWLEKTIRATPPKGKLGHAIHYMQERWGQLTNYLKDGRLEIDNNLIENDVRPFAIGKKNWLFSGSPRGAKAGAVFYTLIKTAQANGLDPYRYLVHVLNKIRDCQSDEDYRQLLPWSCKDKVIQS